MAPSRNFVQNNDKFDLDDILLSVPTDLNACQQLAYLAAARHKAVLIAGGAGVGKSYVVGKIACLYADHGYRVALAAPTGKAAKRIEQIVDMPAQTVHRLLKYNGHEFARNEESPLNCDVVTVQMNLTNAYDQPEIWHPYAFNGRLDAEVLDPSQFVTEADGTIVQPHNASRMPPGAHVVETDHAGQGFSLTGDIPRPDLDEIATCAGPLLG